MGLPHVTQLRNEGVVHLSTDEALKALERARKQCDRVSQASLDPQEPELGVTWAFYAYENGVTAVAEALRIP